MIEKVLRILLLILILIFSNPVYSNDLLEKDIQDYTLKISTKFSSTYCNTIKFGISKEGALKFAIGETNKEFLNNKLNKYINYELLNKNILVSLRNSCEIDSFPVKKLQNLVFN